MFRRKPPGDIAQHVIALMGNPSQWEMGLFSARHTGSELIVHSDWSTAISVGGPRLRLEGRDRWAVQRAYQKLRLRAREARQSHAAQRIRESLALPEPTAPSPALAPFEPEPIEVVEARVRQLREAVLRAAA